MACSSVGYGSSVTVAGILEHAATASAGTLSWVSWSERGLELHPVVSALLGLVVLGIVYSLVRFLRSQHEPAGDDASPILETADEGGHVDVRQVDGDWTWRVRRLETVARSVDRPDSQAEATDRIEALRDVVADAGVRELSEPAVRLSETGDGTWRWTLARPDGTILADAPRAFDDREEAESAVAFLTTRGPDADALEVGTGAFTVVRRGGRWHWRLLDAKRDPLAESAAGYPNPERADAAIDRFLEALESARVLCVDHVGVELHADDEWGWRLVDEDDEVLVDSVGGFEDRHAAEDEADAVREALATADVTVAGEPTYERFPVESGDGGRWRLVDDTGRIVAHSPDGSPSDEPTRGIDSFADTVGEAPVLEIDGAAYEVFPAMDLDSVSGSTAPTEAAAVRADGEGADASSNGSQDGAQDEGDSSGPRDGSDSSEATDSSGATDDRREWGWRLVSEDRTVLALGIGLVSDPDAAEVAIDRVRERAAAAEIVVPEEAAFRLYRTDSGEWRWRLLDENGSLLADSDAVHDSRGEAAEAMLTLTDRATGADVVEVDAPAFELYADKTGDEVGWRWRLVDDAGKHLALGSRAHPTTAGAQEAVERVCKDLEASVHCVERPFVQPYATDVWHWRYVFPGGEVVAVDGDGYATRDELLDHLEELRAVAGDAPVTDVGDYFLQLYDRGAWHVRVLERDREPVADSSVPFLDQESARDVVDTIREHVTDAPVFTVDGTALRLECDDGDWDWRLVTAGRKPVAAGIDGVESEGAVREVVDEVRRLAPLADRIDRTGASFVLEETDDGGWRWRLLAADGRVVATPADEVASPDEAREALETVRSALEDTTVLTLEATTFELYVDDGDWRWRLVDEHDATVLESVRPFEGRTEAMAGLEEVRRIVPEGELSIVD
ncbi:YegP family protein [Natrarchaeobaculum sulfurireducens]|uniref:DUF1508 domain-containing protein n=1 Tax=Natrarchaeobaculum sulfurireducens TaxID=2044521 RepID=A0A346PTK5_9EURY|nr:YegP family protein [Natrarchaeobaculum sulfurireducens]AXR82850.1 hypothetical protein AArcMg_2861 [Natrarchaeobaculum sulfurireducens]